MSKIAVLTDRTSWFLPYARKLIKKLPKGTKLFCDHEDIPTHYDTVFILSYFKKIEGTYLKAHKYNMVVHESALPKGKGWSPLFWQILEGKNKIPVTMFSASNELDSGEIYLKDEIILDGTELNSEIRKKQAEKSFELCLKFIKNMANLRPIRPKKTKTPHYKKRSPKDSELDPQKTIVEQFNLLRIADNEAYPAFFKFKGKRYTLKIFKDEN